MPSMDKLQEQKNYLIEIKNYITEIKNKASKAREIEMKGLQYRLYSKKDTVNKIIDKTERDINYQNNCIESYELNIGINSDQIDLLERPYTKFTNKMVTNINNAQFKITNLKHSQYELEASKQSFSFTNQILHTIAEVSELGRNTPYIERLIRLASDHLEGGVKYDKKSEKEFNQEFKALTNKLPKGLRISEEQQMER